MQETALKGRRFTGSTRPPKQFSTTRTCAGKGCDTLLSRYNKREYCFTHAPTKYPRLRGRIVKSEA